jgi:hypothetical protein
MNISSFVRPKSQALSICWKRPLPNEIQFNHNCYLAVSLHIGVLIIGDFHHGAINYVHLTDLLMNWEATDHLVILQERPLLLAHGLHSHSRFTKGHHNYYTCSTVWEKVPGITTVMCFRWRVQCFSYIIGSYNERCLICHICMFYMHLVM